MLTDITCLLFTDLRVQPDWRAGADQPVQVLQVGGRAALSRSAPAPAAQPPAGRIPRQPPRSWGFQWQTGASAVASAAATAGHGPAGLKPGAPACQAPCFSRLMERPQRAVSCCQLSAVQQRPLGWSWQAVRHPAAVGCHGLLQEGLLMSCFAGGADECHKCKQRGHWARDCPQASQTNSSS